MFFSQDLCVVCNFWSSARRKESRATPQRTLSKNVSKKNCSCGFGAVWQLVFWRWNSLRCVFVRGMALARTIFCVWCLFCCFIWFGWKQRNNTFFFEWVCSSSIELVYVWFHVFFSRAHFPQKFHVCWTLGRALEGQGTCHSRVLGWPALLGGCGHDWWKPWTFVFCWKTFFRVWKIESTKITKWIV